MQPQPDWPRTLEEFRAWHQRQPEVWEFIDGTPKLMTPGSKAHTLIKTNVGSALREGLRGTGCSVLIDGAIVEVHGSSLIPDIVVTCTPLDFSTPRVDEPVVIVEILSPSNEADDIGRKLALYLEIPGLRHYLVVHQDRRQIVHHERQAIRGARSSPTSRRPIPCGSIRPASSCPWPLCTTGCRWLRRAPLRARPARARRGGCTDAARCR
jgi:Uma2 family endonuclease